MRKRPVKTKQLGNLKKCVDEKRASAWRSARSSFSVPAEFDVEHPEVAEIEEKLDFGNIKVLDRETKRRRRVVKEAISTRKLEANNTVKHDISQLL